jgi:hypothetical protein
MTQRFWLAGLAVLLAMSTAGAITEVNAFTNSNLISYDSNFSALKTISEGSFTLPNVKYKFSGETTTDVSLSERGTSNITQIITFSAPNKTASGGLVSIENHVICTNATKFDTRISGSTSVSSLAENSTTVRSTSFGLGIASTGSGNYSFSVSGGHYTEADHQVTADTTGNPSAYNISFEMYPLDLTEPANIDQDIKLEYGVDDGDLCYYGYNFYRGMEVGDVSSICEMELKKWA